MNNKFLLSAGIICLFSALLHTVGGQMTLVNPMLQSTMDAQVKTEWLGAWHLITILLWVFGYTLLKNGLKFKVENKSLISSISFLCFLFALSFIGASIYQEVHAMQYILFLPISLLSYLGLRRIEVHQA